MASIWELHRHVNQGLDLKEIRFYEGRIWWYKLPIATYYKTEWNQCYREMWDVISETEKVVVWFRQRLQVGENFEGLCKINGISEGENTSGEGTSMSSCIH